LYTHIDVLHEYARQRHQHLIELARPRAISPAELAVRQAIGRLLIRIARRPDATRPAPVTGPPVTTP